MSASPQKRPTFSVVQAHRGRDAAIAMLRAVEQTSERRLS
jgi:hypothetical protein